MLKFYRVIHVRAAINVLLVSVNGRELVATYNNPQQYQYTLIISWLQSSKKLLPMTKECVRRTWSGKVFSSLIPNQKTNYIAKLQVPTLLVNFRCLGDHHGKIQTRQHEITIDPFLQSMVSEFLLSILNVLHYNGVMEGVYHTLGCYRWFFYEQKSGFPLSICACFAFSENIFLLNNY